MRSSRGPFDPPRATGPVVALLLAAGRSTRMGTLKALLPWHGTSLVRYGVEQLYAAGADDVIVVLGHLAPLVAPALDGLSARIVVNPEYDSGRASSIRAGAARAPDDARTIVVLSVDQPRPAPLIADLLRAHHAGEALISSPEHGGRRGHPVLLDGSLLPELRRVDEANEGLRAVVRGHADRRASVPCADARVHRELNTPDDYLAALAEDRAVEPSHRPL